MQAARADREAADPEGTYFAAFVKKLAQVQGPALQACRALRPPAASADFQAVARLSAEGSVEELLLSTTSGFHDCVKQKLRAATLPRPPKSPYWIFWGVRS